MRTHTTSLALAMLVAADVAAAQATRTPGCPAPEFHQFDFWIGRWDVKSPDGKPLGSSWIEAPLDGCAIVEHWTANNGVNRGTSLNFYDRFRKQWTQTWIDNVGLPLRLAGGIQNGAMVMEATFPGPNNTTVRNRITWRTLDGGIVQQLWETSSDDGATWKTTFDGRYSPAAARPG